MRNIRLFWEACASRLQDAYTSARGALQQTLAHLRTLNPSALLHSDVLFDSKRRGAVFMALALPVLSGYACLTQIGYEVRVDGTPIGFVQSEDMVASAVSAIETDVSETLATTYDFPLEVSCKPARGMPDEFLEPSALVTSIVDQTESLDTLAVITVDGAHVGACKSIAQAQNMLASVKAQYLAQAGEQAEFVQAVSVQSTIAPAAMRKDTDTLFASLTSLVDVESTRAITYTEEIPFATVTKENSELEQTYSAVVQPGQSGTAVVVAEVKSLDGEEQTRTELDRAVINPAQDEVVEVGTKNIGIGTGEFSLPIQSYTFTSAFKWRWGRLHAGVDLAAPEGTPIYAADNGVVTISESSGNGYGSYITIDHQNGYETLYGHNSQLLVSAGTIVAKGDLIAYSGNTGNSTGPHLHFEVHVNGEKVDPQGYLSF